MSARGFRCTRPLNAGQALLLVLSTWLPFVQTRSLSGFGAVSEAVI